MSIETTLANLIVALNENTAALKAAAGATPATAPATVASTAGAPAKGKPPAAAKSTKTRGEVNAALTKVKEDKGAPAAKSIIKEVGLVDKMADIPEDKFDAVFAAAAAAVAEDDDGM